MPNDQFEPDNFLKGGEEVEADTRATFPVSDDGYDEVGYAIYLAIHHVGYLPILESAAGDYPIDA